MELNHGLSQLRHGEGRPGGLRVDHQRSIKYTASRTDIVNDFYVEIQSAMEAYKHNREALAALERIEDIAIWWANTPALMDEARELRKEGDAWISCLIEGKIPEPK